MPPTEQTGMDLTDVIEDARSRGFTHNFGIDKDALHCAATDERFSCEESWIVGSTTVDMGTDPGDDSTLYLVETAGGTRGYVVVPSSFHAEAEKVTFIDRMKSHPRSATPDH